MTFPQFCSITSVESAFPRRPRRFHASEAQVYILESHQFQEEQLCPLRPGVAHHLSSKDTQEWKLEEWGMVGRSGDPEGARAPTTRVPGLAQPPSARPGARDLHPLSSGAGVMARRGRGKDRGVKERLSTLYRAVSQTRVERQNSAPDAD